MHQMYHWSIDMPSGLYADKSSKENTVIKKLHTYFKIINLLFLLPENENYCGTVHLLHIGLHKDFEEAEEAIFELTEEALVRSIYKPRKQFSHKGNFGHAALLWKLWNDGCCCSIFLSLFKKWCREINQLHSRIRPWYFANNNPRSHVYCFG